MTTQLAELTTSTAMEVFTSDNGLDSYVQQVIDEVNEFQHDLSTGASRARTIALAGKVAKIKVKYDECGKDLVSTWKENAKKVDSARKKMRDQLDDLKIIARKPVTDWESEQAEIEVERLALIEAEKFAIQYASDYEIAHILDEKFDRDLDDKRIKLEAEQKIESERLESIRIERENQIKFEAAEAARIESERLSLKAIEDAKAEKQKAIADKIKADNDLLAAQAREQLLKEQAEKTRINNEWNVYISEAYQINNDLNAKAEQKRQQAYTEDMRLKSIEQERLAGIERQRVHQANIDAQQLARDNDKVHKSSVKKAILDVLIANNIPEEYARAMIQLAANKALPKLTINY